MYQGYGVHHVAVGVRDLEAMRAFYRDVLEFTEVSDEFPLAEYPALNEVVRASRVVYGAVLFTQPAGGIIHELMQVVDPAPRPIRNNTRYGDIGVAKITMTVPDVSAVYRELKGRVDFCFEPKSDEIPGFGPCRFVYFRDPEGNLCEFFSAPQMPVQGRFGGISWVGIAVTDLERSIGFYRKYGGFDKVIIDRHDVFSGLLGGVTADDGTRIRSCLLANSAAEGMVELVEVAKPRGRSLPFAMRWGDFGYHQVCLRGRQGDDISEIAAYFEEEGIDFVCTPQFMGDEKGGAFFYMKDPDGIPIEFLIFLK
jgi:catechol 2,3-dioxygenase-like lactoylglutathione lyase family enzyme